MGMLALIALALAVTFAAKSSKATTASPTTKPGTPPLVSPGGPVVPGMGGPAPTYAPAAACRPVTGVGASDRGPFTDGKGVVWCLMQTMGTPGTNVWQAYTQGYGLPERTIAAPDRTTLVQGIQLFASYNTPVAASGPGALPGALPSGTPSVPTVPGVPGTSVVSPCGVYPPLVGGWRPVCTTEHLPATALVPPSSRVELTIQEGARPIEDTTHMMQIEGVVTGGDPVNGYDVAFLGSVKATSDVALAAPLLGTTFKQVRPSFIHRIVPADAPPGTEGLPPLPGLPGGIPGMA